MNGIPKHLAADIQRGFVNISEEDDLIHHAERKLRVGAKLSAGLFLTLVAAIVKLSPYDTYEEPGGLDRDSHLLTSLLIFVVTCVRMLQMLMKERSTGFLRSGIVAGTMTVQGIALLSNLSMALLPCPVLYDEVTGQRTHLIRYAEWTALAFLMVFLTDNIDTNRGLKFQSAACVALSTTSGIILPMCKTFSTWIFVFLVAVVLFMDLYVVLYKRVTRYYGLRNKMMKGLLQQTAAEHEQYDIARSSFLLTFICSVAWTILIVSYVAVCTLPYYVPAEYIPSAALSLHSCCNEVLSKIWYLNTLLEAYDNVFDINQRVSRRLEELRRFMSAIWQSSSDTIIFCVAKNEDHISARISPAFLSMSGLCSGESKNTEVSLLLEIHPLSGTFTTFEMDISKPFGRDSASSFRASFKASGNTEYTFREFDHYPEEMKNLASLARYVVEVIAGKGMPSEGAEHVICFCKTGKQLSCESKVSSLQDGCTVIVLRDITDRVERFEVEKKLVEEKAVRSKDAETNHFTRHEVKNGILASIGLLDHMRDCMRRKIERMGGSDAVSLDSSGHCLNRTSSHNSLKDTGDLDAGVENTLEELDSTLHDVLDTILDEVMAREIVYGEYKPRKERIDVLEVLATIRRGSSAFFPLEMYPSQFPVLVLDRQLLRHIYRNALSNACRYGKYNGTVQTILRYDESKKTFTMEVVNEPGDGHEELQQLSTEQVASVFTKGTQLEMTKVMNRISRMRKSERKESSGNGAWIMRKCAENLHGQCGIKFNPDCTVFHFECPAEAVRLGYEAGHEEKALFGLPTGTKCVVIEDSQVQRKLLDRMLKNSGVPSADRLMLGKDSSEILGSPERLKNMIQDNPKDLFLLIVDENLDIVRTGGVDVETVSGSGLVEKLRTQLEPQDEKRVLALVRSANDSAKDIELYLERAHGYLLKEPIKKGMFLEAVKPWWIKRFPDEARIFTEHEKHEEEVVGPLPDDIRSSLDQIQSLSSNHDAGVLSRRWSVIRERLQVLKGDLKTMSSDAKVLEAVQDLATLQAPEVPNHYLDDWEILRQKIEDLL